MPRYWAAVLATLVIAGPAAAQPLTKFDAATDWPRFTKFFSPLNARDDRVVTVEADGLSFDFEAIKRGELSGMVGEFALRGDFHAAVKFELTEFPDAVADGYGVQVGLWVNLNEPPGEAGVNRGVFAGAGHQMRMTRSYLRGDQKQWAMAGVPTRSRGGRLAMQRVGTDIVALSADTPDGELVEWRRWPFTGGTVRYLAITADTGGATVPIKGRLYDLQIRTGSDVPKGAPRRASSVVAPLPDDLPPPTPPTEAVAVASPDSEAPAPARSRVWQFFVVGVACLIVGVFIGRRTIAAALLMLLVATPADAQTLAKGFDSAKNPDRFRQLFELLGDDAKQAVTYLPDGGVRIHVLPRKNGGHVGVRTHDSRILGDFQVEVKYDFEKFPEKVTKGYGAGFGFYVDIGGEFGGASIRRGTFVNHGHQIHAGRAVPKKSGGLHYATRSAATTSRSGRLALRRVGSEVIMLAADTPDGELLELTRYPYSARPTAGVALYADPGGFETEMIGRLYDFKVLTGRDVPGNAPRGPATVEEVPLPPNMPADAPEAVAKFAPEEIESPVAEAPVRGRWWIPVLTFIAGVIVGVIATRAKAKS